MKTKLTTADWLKAIADANQSKADKVPEGWITLHEIGEMANLHSLESIHLLLKSLMAMNKIETKTFRCLDSRGRVKHIKHYRLT